MRQGPRDTKARPLGLGLLDLGVSARGHEHPEESVALAVLVRERDELALQRGALGVALRIHHVTRAHPTTRHAVQGHAGVGVPLVPRPHSPLEVESDAPSRKAPLERLRVKVGDVREEGPELGPVPLVDPPARLGAVVTNGGLTTSLDVLNRLDDERARRTERRLVAIREDVGAGGALDPGPAPIIGLGLVRVIVDGAERRARHRADLFEPPPELLGQAIGARRPRVTFDVVRAATLGKAELPMGGDAQEPNDVACLGRELGEVEGELVLLAQIEGFVLRRVLTRDAQTDLAQKHQGLAPALGGHDLHHLLRWILLLVLLGSVLCLVLLLGSVLCLVLLGRFLGLLLGRRLARALLLLLSGGFGGRVASLLLIGAVGPYAFVGVPAVEPDKCALRGVTRFGVELGPEPLWARSADGDRDLLLLFGDRRMEEREAARARRVNDRVFVPLLAFPWAFELHVGDGLPEVAGLPHVGPKDVGI